MPTYAILGATGNTGLALLQILSQHPTAQINAYCRSKAKLLKLSPALAHSKQVQIFEGPLQDTSLIASCLRNTRAAFLTVAQAENVPGTTVARDTARVVIAALEKLRSEDKGARLPRLVILSSASLEEKFNDEMPKFVHHMLLLAASNVYHDLREAEKLLRSKESLVSSTFVRPGGLSHDTQKGHVVVWQTAKTPVSYLDLAAGMVEVADEEGGLYDMKGVTVNPTAGDVKFPWEAPVALLRGLLFHFCPWMYWFWR